MKFVLGFAFLIIFIGSFQAIADDPKAKPQIVQIDDNQSSQIDDKQIREFFEQSGTKIVDYSHYPELKPLLGDISKLTQTIVNSDDGSKPIHVVLIDNSNLGAFFLRLPEDGPRVLGVNVGTANFVQSDDEIVFILGHELEHGVSQLEDYAKKQGDVYRAALMRAVEDEVDVKSVVKRVYENGYNPYAAKDNLDRIVETFGDDISTTHVTTSVRSDVIGSTLTGMTRGMGKQIDHTNYKHPVHTAAKAVLTAPVYLERRQREIDALLTAHEDDFDEIFKGIPSGQFKEEDTERFPKAFNKRARRIAEIGTGHFTPEQMLDHYLELMKNLHQDYQEARVRILGKDFKPRSLAQAAALIDLARIGVEIPHLNSHQFTQVVEYGREIGDLKKRRSDIQYEISNTARRLSEEREIDSKIGALRKKIATLATAYNLPPEEVQSLSERAGDLLRGRNQIPPEVFKIEERLKSATKKIGHIPDPMIEIRPKIKGLILDTPIDFENDTRSLEKLIFALPKEQINDTYIQLLAKIRRELEGYLKTEKKVEKIVEAYKTSLALLNSFSWGLNQASDYKFQQPPEFISLLKFMASQAPDLETLHLTFPEISPFKSSYAKDIEVSRSGRLIYQAPIAQKELSLEEITTYLQRKTEILKKLMAEADFKTVVGYVNEFGFELSKMLRFFPQARQVDQSIREMMQIYVAKASQELFKGNASLGKRLSTSLFFANFPEFRDPTFFKTVPSRADIAKDLTLIAKSKAGSHVAINIPTKHLLDLAKVEHKSDPDRYRQVEKWSGLTKDNPFRRSIIMEAEDFPPLHRMAQWALDNPTHIDMAERALVRHHVTYDSARLYDTLSNYDDNFIKKMIQSVYDTPGLSRRQRMERLADLLTRYPLLQDINWHGNDLRSGFAKWIKPEDQLEFIMAYHKNVTKQFAERYIKIAITYTPDRADEIRSHYTSSAERFASDLDRNFFWDDNVDNLLAKTPIETLARYFAESSRFTEPSTDRNKIFDILWEARDTNKHARKALLRADLVKAAFFDADKAKLAKWQLDRKFGVAQRAAKLKKPQSTLVGRNEVRKRIKEIKQFVDKQFAEAGTVKDSVIEHVESQLLTTHAETKLLNSSRLNTENWVESSHLVAIDGAAMIEYRMKSNVDRYQFIEYLLGNRRRYPEFVLEDRLGEPQKVVDAAKNAFSQADPLARSFYLQQFLDEKTGILSDPEIAEDLTRLILGEKANETVFRKLFSAYLNSVPPAEKKVIFSYIISTLSSGKKGASAKSILEAMGPFGIKAGQFIRSTGLAGPELAKELDDFFDNAIRPSRPGIYNDLEKSFSKSLGPVKKVRQLVGSGSINYAVLVDFEDAKTGKLRQAVVRFQRENVFGKVANENKNWEGAIGILSQDDDKAVRQLALTLDEARLGAMDTLREGGTQLDLGFERTAHERAHQSYSSDMSRETGLRVEVGKPLDDLQGQIPEDLQSKVSLYEYVPNQSFEDLQPDEQRKIAKQIMEGELRALFRNGEFDPDGHRGNWLIDKDGNRLVRIDYAEFQNISKKDRDSVKKALSLMFLPTPNARDINKFSTLVSSLYEVPSVKMDMIKTLTQIFNNREFPAPEEPHMRLLFIRQHLEMAVREIKPDARVRLRTPTRAALGSMGRLLYYRQYMPDQEFFSLIAKHVPLPKRVLITHLRTAAKRKWTQSRTNFSKWVEEAATKAHAKVSRVRTAVRNCPHEVARIIRELF